MALGNLLAQKPIGADDLGLAEPALTAVVEDQHVVTEAIERVAARLKVVVPLTLGIIALLLYLTFGTVAETAIGESTNTGIKAGNRPSSAP